MAALPLQVNALIIADEPTSSISVFSDRAHTAWQEVHGALPEPLLEFLQGELSSAHSCVLSCCYHCLSWHVHHTCPLV